MNNELAIEIGTLILSGLTIIAIFSAPIVALRIQRQIETEREAQGRKLWIFKTLMGYRATRLNSNFVQALNMIDIEFTGKGEKAVRDSWKELLDHYTTWGAKSEAQRKIDDKSDEQKSTDLLAEMLVIMGKELNYSFDKFYVKKGCYYPEGLGSIEAEQHQLRRSVLALLSGRGMKLPVAVFAQDFQPLAKGLKNEEVAPEGLKPPPLKISPPTSS